MAARRRRNQDRFGRQAKAEGLRARSVFKLEEIDRRIGLLKPGMRVLDLGAYPGSWTVYAAQKVGPKGKVLGIDIQPDALAPQPNAEIRQADVFTVAAEALGGPGSFDVVLSDMAPSTTGTRYADQYRSYELVMRALDIARSLLVPGGRFVAKIFQGAEFPDARKAVASSFTKVRILRPEAIRSDSYEVYLVGLDLRTPPT